MALTLSKTGITTGQTVQPFHVTQSVDALTGLVAYDIKISGSLQLTGSVSSQNGFVGNLTGTSSWASNASVSNLVRPSNTTANTRYTVPYLSGTGSTAGLYYSSLGPTYNPVSETLSSKNFEGTASWASNVVTVPTQVVISGDAYPSGSAYTPNSLFKFIAGADKTGNAPNTAAITITALTGKILGQDCFVTVGVSGSLGTNNTVVVNSLVGNTLTFESQAPNTDFYYQVMYI